MKQIAAILLRELDGVLSLTGGGGKTSLMFHLAKQLSRAGQRVLTTTTTKIFHPTADQSKTLLVGQALDGVRVLAEHPLAFTP